MYDNDLNGDGIVSDKEIQLIDRKMTTHRKMSWVALVSMLIFTCVLFSPLVSDGRVDVLSDLVGLYYISMAGIIASYFGASTWLSK